MIIKARWVSLNPFLPRWEDLVYTKTVEVPDDSDMEQMEEFAKQDTKKGYRFDKLEILED